LSREKEERIAKEEKEKELRKDNFIKSFLDISPQAKKTLLYPFPTTYEKYRLKIVVLSENGTVQMLVLMLTMLKMIDDRTCVYSTVPYSTAMIKEFKELWARLFGKTRDSECQWTKAFCSLAKESYCTMTLSSGSRVQQTPTSLLNHGAAIRFCSDMDRLLSYGQVLVEFKRILLLRLLPGHSERIKNFVVLNNNN